VKQILLTVMFILISMLSTGLAVTVYYQRAEIAFLQERLAQQHASSIKVDGGSSERAGTAQITSAAGVDSVVEKRKKAANDSIYRQLKNTCRNWKNWYAEDGKISSRVNRDNACNRAADYGEQELGIVALPDAELDSKGGTRVSDTKTGDHPPLSTPSRSGSVSIMVGRAKEQKKSGFDGQEVGGATSFQDQLEAVQRQLRSQQYESR